MFSEATCMFSSSWRDVIPDEQLCQLIDFIDVQNIDKPQQGSSPLDRKFRLTNKTNDTIFTITTGGGKIISD